MKIFNKNIEKKKMQKIIYTAVFAVLAVWFVYRFVMVALESKMRVFNPVRDAETHGIVVQTITASRTDGEIKIPIAVNNNRAYVSGAQKNKLRVGQHVGDGEITYVSAGLDLDSGMYIVKTRGVQDGINYVSIKYNCFYIPVYAVHNGVLMIYNNGMAVQKNVNVGMTDSENACILDGLENGDIVILSNVDSGQKIKIQD